MFVSSAQSPTGSPLDSASLKRIAWMPYRRAVVDRALGRGGLAEGARAVGAAAVGRRRVRGPGVGVEQGRPVRHGIRAPCRRRRARTRSRVDVDGDVAPGRDRASRPGSRRCVRVVVVLEPQPAHVGRRGARVASARSSRPDVPPLDSTSLILTLGQRVVRRWPGEPSATERGAGEQHRHQDGQGRTTQGHRVPRGSAAESAVGEQPKPQATGRHPGERRAKVGGRRGARRATLGLIDRTSSASSSGHPTVMRGTARGCRAAERLRASTP